MYTFTKHMHATSRLQIVVVFFYLFLNFRTSCSISGQDYSKRRPRYLYTYTGVCGRVCPSTIRGYYGGIMSMGCAGMYGHAWQTHMCGWLQLDDEYMHACRTDAHTAKATQTCRQNSYPSHDSRPIKPYTAGCSGTLKPASQGLGCCPSLGYGAGYAAR